MTEPSTSPSAKPQCRLFLVEDNPVFAEVIDEAMAQLPQSWSVSLVDSGGQALQMLQQQTKPFDLVLVDIGLPDISGIEVIRACSQRFPDMPIVVISVLAAEAAVLRAIEAGAKGYILKDEPVSAIADGIAQVMRGIYPLSPALARVLFRRVATGSPEVERSVAGTPGNDFGLTPREHETLQHLADGHTYDRVAQLMGVSLSTIQTHVRNLYRKLNVRSQVQAITKARSHDLL